MWVPGAAVLGDAKASQAQPFGFQNQVFRGKIAIAAALGGVDMKVEYSRNIRAITSVALSYQPSAISFLDRIPLIVDCPLSLSVMTVIVNG